MSAPTGRITRWSSRFADAIGLYCGVIMVAAAIGFSTYYGYRAYNFEGAFFAFLVVFIISGLLMKPVLLLFQGLGRILSYTLEFAARHYLVSAMMSAGFLLGLYVYYQRFGVPQVVTHFSSIYLP